MEHQKTTAVNLLHVLTQHLDPTRVPVMKDILAMEKHVKVRQHRFLQTSNLIIAAVTK